MPDPRRLARTDIEPDNDYTDTPTTMSIDGLFYLSFFERLMGVEAHGLGERLETLDRPAFR